MESDQSGEVNPKADRRRLLAKIEFLPAVLPIAINPRMKSGLWMVSIFSFLSIACDAADTGDNPFRRVLSDEDYAQKLAHWEKIREDSRKQSSLADYPSAGVRVSSVPDGSAADKAGIPRDSIIFARDEMKSWSGFLQEPLMEKPYTLHFVTPEGVPQSRRMDAGPLGAGVSGSHRIDLAYLRGEAGTRGAAWDEEILQACRCWKSDRDTCETALHLAIENGYPPDALTDWFRVQFALLSEDGPEAELESFLGHFDARPLPWVYIPPLHDALVVCGRIDFMQRIEKEAGGNCAFDKETIERFLQWTDGDVKLPSESLLESARAGKKVSINEIFESVDDVTEEERRALMGKPFSYSSPPRFIYQTIYRPEPSASGEERTIPHNIHYRLVATPFATGHDKKWPTNFRVGFTNIFTEESPAPAERRYEMRGPALSRHCLDVYIYKPFGSMTLLSTNANGFPGIKGRRKDDFTITYIDDPKLPDSFSDRFEQSRDKWTDVPDPLVFDLIRKGNEIGAFVNGVCVVHLPADPANKDEIEIAIRSIGMEVYVHEQDLWEFVD